MLNEDELKQELAKVCNGTKWTWIRNEGNAAIWRCDACGAETRDNLTISWVLVYGPHYKPRCEPIQIPSAFYKAFE